MVAQVTAGYIKDMQVVLHIPRWFWLLVFLANPQARTGLPTKIGILLQHCRQSQARPLSITSRLVPNPLAVTSPLISVGQTYACWRLPPASEDGGTWQSQVPGLCVVVMLARAAAGRAAIASNTGCGLFTAQEHILSTATTTFHQWHSSG